MAKTPEHTPTPWTVERQDDESGCIYYAIHAQNYEFVTNLHDDLTKAKTNAELIVRAVNCHDELVRALEKAQSAITQAHSRVHTLPRTTDTELARALGEANRDIHAALAKARGETP